MTTMTLPYSSASPLSPIKEGGKLHGSGGKGIRGEETRIRIAAEEDARERYIFIFWCIHIYIHVCTCMYVPIHVY